MAGSSTLRDVLVVGLTLCLLGAAAGDRMMSMVTPEDTAEYQARIREAEKALPLRIGNWLGRDVPVPPSASALLHPNVMISRQYANFVTGRTATFLLVQCSDARDMAGHYPPNCYPNQGWLMEGSQEKRWQIGGMDLHGIEYRFRRSAEDTGVVVRNFLLLPDGRTVPDMETIRKSTSVRRRFYGAGQVQVIVEAGVPEGEQEEIFEQLVTGHQAVIQAVLAGIR